MDKVMSALGELGITTHATASDLAINPNPINVILFLAQLYERLPNYIPKQTINFDCVLGQEVVKKIELVNPNPRFIEYYINLEGKKNDDFSIENNAERITIPPKSNA